MPARRSLGPERIVIAALPLRQRLPPQDAAPLSLPLDMSGVEDAGEALDYLRQTRQPPQPLCGTWSGIGWLRTSRPRVAARPPETRCRAVCAALRAKSARSRACRAACPGA